VVIAWTARSAAAARTDEDGRMQISDRVPADAARYRVEVLNSRGMVIRVMEAQQTEEQRIEAAALAEAEAEAERAREAQERHDNMLMQSYTSVADIERARDGRLQALAAQIRVAQAAVDNLQDNYDGLVARTERLEGDGRPVPEDLAQQVERARSQLEANQRFVAAREQEHAELSASFAADIDRYKELRGIVD
jgi:chromosome segregation ATPase